MARLFDTSLSKRTFLKSAGALGLMTTPAMRAAAATESWDIIVVGGGTAGLPTAIFAGQRGAKVLVIERSGLLGGTLDRSSGQIAAAGTKFQKDKGIKDTVQDHYEDIMRLGDNTGDPALVRLFAENATATLDWLYDRGYKILPEHPIKEGGHEPFRIPRYQWGPDGGRSILKVLLPAFEEQVARGKVSVLFHSDAVELMQDKGGAVTGLVVADENGTRISYNARAVVLATGGTGGNPKMFQELHNVPMYCRIMYPYNQGRGIELGVAAGGTVRNKGFYLPTFGTILTDDNFPSPMYGVSGQINPKTRAPWEIWVNKAGERFVREDEQNVHHREVALTKQPGHRCFVVFDQTIFEKAPALMGSMPADRLEAAFRLHPMFAKGETLGAIAQKAGIDAKGLARTVASYNAGVLEGKDVLGREHLPLPIAKPPFYSIAHNGYCVLTWAGLGIDASLRVVRGDGSPIPNLYAIGETLGAATFGRNYINGMMVTPALTLGRLLGSRMIKL